MRHEGLCTACTDTCIIWFGAERRQSLVSEMIQEVSLERPAVVRLYAIILADSWLTKNVAS